MYASVGVNQLKEHGEIFKLVMATLVTMNLIIKYKFCTSCVQCSCIEGRCFFSVSIFGGGLYASTDNFISIRNALINREDCELITRMLQSFYLTLLYVTSVPIAALLATDDHLKVHYAVLLQYLMHF